MAVSLLLVLLQFRGIGIKLYRRKKEEGRRKKEKGRCDKMKGWGASHFCKLVVQWSVSLRRDRARELCAPTTVFFGTLRCSQGFQQLSWFSLNKKKITSSYQIWLINHNIGVVVQIPLKEPLLLQKNHEERKIKTFP